MNMSIKRIPSHLMTNIPFFLGSFEIGLVKYIILLFLSFSTFFFITMALIKGRDHRKYGATIFRCFMLRKKLFISPIFLWCFEKKYMERIMHHNIKLKKSCALCATKTTLISFRKCNLENVDS